MPVSQSPAIARTTLNNNNIDSECNKAELKRWIPKTFFSLEQLVPALSGEEGVERGRGWGCWVMVVLGNGWKSMKKRRRAA